MGTVGVGISRMGGIAFGMPKQRYYLKVAIALVPNSLKPIVGVGATGLMVWDFMGILSLVLVHLREATLLWGGAMLWMCLLVVDYHSSWQDSQVCRASWDCCALHSPVHYWW